MLLLATPLNVPIPEGFVSEMAAFVKLPVVARDQYSLVLKLLMVPSGEPPALLLNACTCAVMAPVPVFGVTRAYGR